MRMRACVVLAALAACKSASSGPSCAEVARRVTELVAARERADRELHPGTDLPELDHLMDEAMTDAMIASCEAGNISAEKRRCIARDAKTAFDLTGECGVYAMGGLVGPELECPTGAHQRSPHLRGDDWETWCEASGKRNGESMTFDDGGEWITAATYKDDVLDGEYSESDGLYGQYRAGKKHGTWLRKHRSGYKQAEVEFVDGVAAGHFATYYDSQYENVDEEGAYADDRPTGEWTGRWENSHHLQYKGSYDAKGERSGSWTFFHDLDGAGAGPVAATGTYKDGERVAGWTFKTATGKPMTEDEARELDWLAERLFGAESPALGGRFGE